MYPSLAQIVASERAAFAPLTNLAACDADPLGDGDQAPLPLPSFGAAQQRFVSAWAEGHSVNALLQAPDEAVASFSRDLAPPGEHGGAALSFARACSGGDAAAVRGALAAAAPALRGALLGARLTPLRLSSLHCCVVGAKLAGMAALPPRACVADHAGVAAALLAGGARAGARDVRGYTPLHHATSMGWSAASLAVGAVLLRHGADAGARDRTGRVPLMEAAMSAAAPGGAGKRQQQQGVAALPPARLLLEAGADPAVKDAEGVSPLSLVGPLHFIPGPIAFMEIVSGASRRGRSKAGRTLEGDAVQLHGLGAAELNGRGGVCGAFDAVKGRYVVALEGGEAVAVRPENLAPPGGPAATPLATCAACGKVGELKMCGRCKGAAYCSEKCQRAQWKAHKASCREAGAEAPPRSVLLRAVAGEGAAVGVARGAARGAGAAPMAQYAQWDLEDFRRASNQIVKVQQPVAGGGGGGGGGGRSHDLLLYNEKRNFTCMLDPAKEGYRELLELMGAELKIFVRAELSEDPPGIRVSLKKVAMQAW